MATNNYNIFAKYYDKLMTNISYKEIALRINDIINEYFEEADCLVDLACGTGSLSEEFSKLGFSVMGVDISNEMLSIAEQKRQESGLDIKYICQDISKLKLGNEADVCVSTLDGLNHLENLDDIKSTFKSVGKNLCFDGLFIFDMNTPYKHSEILSDNSFIYEEENVYCVWQNEYNNEDNDNRVDMYLDFFERENKRTNEYIRTTQELSEIAFDDSVIKSIAKANGFDFLESFDEYSTLKAHDQSERILYVFKKKEQ